MLREFCSLALAVIIPLALSWTFLALVIWDAETEKTEVMVSSARKADTSSLPTYSSRSSRLASRNLAFSAGSSR